MSDEPDDNDDFDNYPERSGPSVAPPAVT